MCCNNLHPDSFILCACKLTDTYPCEQDGLVDVVSFFLQSVPCQVSNVPTSLKCLCCLCCERIQN